MVRSTLPYSRIHQVGIWAFAVMGLTPTAVHREGYAVWVAWTRREAPAHTCEISLRVFAGDDTVRVRDCGHYPWLGRSIAELFAGPALARHLARARTP